MRREGWILCLMMTLTLVVTWLVFSVPKAIIGSWPPCQDMSGCGQCEIMLRPNYRLPVCEQNFNCRLLNADPL
jgi:hypothetical protein